MGFAGAERSNLPHEWDCFVAQTAPRNDPPL